MVVAEFLDDFKKYIIKESVNTNNNQSMINKTARFNK